MEEAVAFDLGLEGWTEFQEAERRHLKSRDLPKPGGWESHVLQVRVSGYVCPEHTSRVIEGAES